MRNVDDVHVLATQSERNRDVMPPQRFVFRLIELFEILGERSEFVKVAMRADQEIFVLMIDRCEIPHQVPYVRTYAEFIDLSDVDGDAHEG